MLAKIGLILIGMLVSLLSYVSFQPADYLIAREITIKAAPEVIFPHLSNSKKTNEWMPWAESDPQLKMSFSGPEEGVGSISTWESEGQMGFGKAEVVEVVPNQKVKTQLTYTKPMQMEQVSEFTLTSSAQGTTMKWSVVGKNNLIGRIFCVFVNMDKMVGTEFEKGLSKLKDKVEKGT